jgi:hypothetical protein
LTLTYFQVLSGNPKTCQVVEILGRKKLGSEQWLWQEATVIADEILDCELAAVLEKIPDLAVVSSGEGSDLTEA